MLVNYTKGHSLWKQASDQVFFSVNCHYFEPASSQTCLCDKLWDWAKVVASQVWLGVTVWARLGIRLNMFYSVAVQTWLTWRHCMCDETRKLSVIVLVVSVLNWVTTYKHQLTNHGDRKKLNGCGTQFKRVWNRKTGACMWSWLQVDLSVFLCL